MERNGNFIRSTRDKNFKIISCEVLDDKKLSFRAKGIHAYLMSRPDGWRFHKDQIEALSTEGRDAFNTAVNELKEHGYLRITPTRGKSGEFTGWEWFIYDSPTFVVPEVQVSSTSENPYLNNIEDTTNTTPITGVKDTNQEGLTTNILGEKVREVFEYWQKAMNYPNRKFVDSRKAPIKARLSDGFSVEQLKAAIDVASKDPFWRGKNDRKTPYDDIDNIFRNTARVEKFLSQVDRKQQLTWISTPEERERNKGKWIKD